ncbi:sigma-70 family RNA polymerase sigma factor [Cytophagaceae bacterium DM2B3-1]|uniref:Sigma-70 family RNA polymerase sigma factor n=1 Tax=Xanthocytophaga flava TaxID=3048013 RepID=A0ABT7CVR1_9BACT|nr:sigma-70 family RNA polymerase sigma factor [Xanthocytophaga flavus]MDJ1466359.1 sigma-70 family RNA polymerase sigma factor [Xanthocytophaga flavus]MDJ1497866.1 sigma-70 family RNA polymerase sigma factor [Xanthocytophaga flavus]
MSDENIIARIRQGDESKLMAIYRAYRNDFIFWAMRHFSCNEEIAKDVFQVAITIFYENIMSGKLSKLSSSVKTYLFAIGKNKLHENQVARERDLKIQQFEQDKIKDGFQLENMEGETSEEKEGMYKMLEKALVELGEPCRSVLEMYYYQDLSIEELATKMDYKSTDSAKTQKYKCLTRLKKIFQESVPGIKNT